MAVSLKVTGPVNFDPAIIAEFAERLYTSANRIILFMTLIGFMSGLFMGGLAFSAFAKTSPPSAVSYVMWGIFILFTSLVGRAIGTERAFRLKLEAQRALCDLAIEQNTRRDAERAAS